MSAPEQPLLRHESVDQYDKTASDPSPHKPLPSELVAAANPSPKIRLLTLLSFPLFILLSIPFWWYTTSIQRLPLPTSRISTLETSPLPSSRITILLTADVSAFPKPVESRAGYDHDTVLSRLAEEVTKGVDGILGQKRPAERESRDWDLVVGHNKETRERKPDLHAHIRVWERANTSFPLEPYIQTPETGLMTSGLLPGTLVIPVHPSQIGDRFLSKHYQIALVKSLMALHLTSPVPPELPLRALKYSPNITLSFVLLNEDASVGSYVRSWDIQGAIRDHFTPHLDVLKDVFEFTIESQVLYHAPLTFESVYGRVPGDNSGILGLDEAIERAGAGKQGAEGVVKDVLAKEGEVRDGAWSIGEEEMKGFINSERWSLDSGSTNNPVLRFLVFVPSAQHRPMRLALPDTAQSFLIPQYGAVTILNPPPTLSTASSESRSSAYHLPLSALQQPFHLLTHHFYSLLDLPHTPQPPLHPPPPLSPLHPTSHLIQPLTPWAVDSIMRKRMFENTLEARKTLVGIVRLVKKIKEMKVGEGVKGLVLGAVEKLEQMERTKDVREAFILSRDAVALANKAFFDPSMMGLLYFPDEHKFAVYTPLFAPIAVPMVVGLLKEFLGWRRRRKIAGVVAAGQLEKKYSAL